ncbi:MAG: hypothetical protein K0B07_05165 [DPANN group archaeon]|nr:hypothetical protein [DPANN group archaeon]
MAYNKKIKGVSGIELLIPIFLMMFSLIVIFAGVEWGVNTLVLMDNEKKVTQMDTELLSVTDLYITPSLKYAMQEVTRDLALHGGLSSEILKNYKLFIEAGTSTSPFETQIENDFNHGNLDFPSITNPPMKIEGDILYWSYVLGENNNKKTIPYTFDLISSTTPYKLYGTRSLQWSPPFTYLITDVDGTVNKYDVVGTNYILSGQYTGPAVISGDTLIKLNMSGGTGSANVEGVYNISSYFEPLFPRISYPDDALAQRTIFPRFTDIMLSDRLNSYRSDYGDSKTDIGSTLSLGTWNAFFVPVLMELDKTVAFYGGNRIVETTSSIEMQNTDPVKSELDNRYWKLFDLANLFMGTITDNDFLDDTLTMNAHYSESYVGHEIFRDKSSKTCSDEWGISCDGITENTVATPSCTPSPSSTTELYIKELTIDSHEYELSEIINVKLFVDCIYNEYFNWTIAYYDGGIDWGYNKTGTTKCPSFAGGSITISEQLAMESTYSGIHLIRASVGNDSTDILGSTCMSADNDDVTFTYLGVAGSYMYADDYVNDTCFDGDKNCIFQKTCNDKYQGTPPQLRPKNPSDKFTTLTAKDGSYESVPIIFDVEDNFNNNYHQKFVNMGLVPFIYENMTKEELAKNISVADEVSLTFNYGSDTTIACSEREDIIEKVTVFMLYNPTLLPSITVETFVMTPQKLTEDTSRIEIGSINPELGATDSSDFYKKQKIPLNKALIAEVINKTGTAEFTIRVDTVANGENIPAQMYPEINSRIYAYDVLTKGAYPSRTIDINPTYITNSLEPSMNYGFKNAKGIATDSYGNIYVINSDDHRLYRYNRFGTFNGWMDLPDLDPRGVDIDTRNGNIYISYYIGKNITRYDNFFDSRNLAQNPGIPPKPFQKCSRFASAYPTDVAFYKGTVFTIFEDNKLDYCKTSSDSWLIINTLPDVAGTDKIMAISVDQAEDRLYAKVNKPTGFVDVNGNPTYYRYYYVYDLSVFVNTLNPTSITRIIDETIPINFSLTYFDIYTPQKGGDTQAYFTYMTKSKKDTYALLDDFRFNIDFGDTFKIEVESMENIKGLTDRIEYYDDGCGSVTKKDNCETLWGTYALNEYFKEISYFNKSTDVDCTELNQGLGPVDNETISKIKTILNIPQDDTILCTKTIDSANIPILFIGDYMELKIKDKIIGPRIINEVRRLNDVYNSEGIYIDVDYTINSDFGTGWDDDGFWKEKDKYVDTRVTSTICTCETTSSASCGSYTGRASDFYEKTESYCEYSYGAIYSMNVTIEDKNTNIWDPILHDMTSLKFKYGFEWSVLDNIISHIYIADERGGQRYCGITPEGCHKQDTFVNYDDAEDDPDDCDANIGADVTYVGKTCITDTHGTCWTGGYHDCNYYSCNCGTSGDPPSYSCDTCHEHCKTYTCSACGYNYNCNYYSDSCGGLYTPSSTIRTTKCSGD